MISNDFEKFKRAVNDGKPVALLVTAKDCAPCEQFKPMYKAASVMEGAKFFALDIQDIPADYIRGRGVRSAPTVMMFRFGLEESRLVGEDLKTFGLTMLRFIGEYMSTTSVNEAVECEACQ